MVYLVENIKLCKSNKVFSLFLYFENAYNLFKQKQDIVEYFCNEKKYFPRAIGKKNLVPTDVPTDRKLQVTLRHFSEAPANTCELLQQPQRAIKVYLLEELR